MCRRLLRTGSLLSAAACLVLGLALPGAAWGVPKPKPTPVFKPPYDAIQSVDTTAGTIVVGHVNSKDTSTKTYKINQFTEIQVNGEKGTITSLQAGMKVAVSEGSETGSAGRVVASPAPTK